MFEEKSKIKKENAKLRNPGRPGWLLEMGVGQDADMSVLHTQNHNPPHQLWYLSQDS